MNGQRAERPAIIKISESDRDGQARVVITLAWQDGEFHGEAIGSADSTARPRLVGEATLRAVEAVTDHRIRLTLSAVATTDLGAAQIAVAQVRIDGADDPLVGSALIGQSDQSAATVRAVLDALNRRLAVI